MMQIGLIIKDRDAKGKGKIEEHWKWFQERFLIHILKKMEEKIN